MQISKRAAFIAVIAIFTLSVTTVGTVAWSLTRGHQAVAPLQAMTGPVPVRLFASPVLNATKAQNPGQATTIADVAEQALPSVVNISTEKSQGQGFHSAPPFGPLPFRFRVPPGYRGQRLRMPPIRGQGSGVIVSSDGVVLTNNHVVSGMRNIRVTLADRREFKARLVGADPKSDLAVIRLQGKVRGLKPVTFGDSDKIRLGEVVLAIGNPFGVGQTVTMGIVSAKGRAMGLIDYEDFIQTDAAINPGNSGGALVNMRGQLVGINTAILSRSGGYQGIGFAIPAKIARHVMGSLLRHGKVRRGFLGVRIQTVTPDLARAMRLSTQRGVLVSDVEPGSAAARAGLRRGDVVLQVGGIRVDTATRLRSQIANRTPGSRVQLKLKRGAKDLHLAVTLGSLGGVVSRGNRPAPTAPVPGAQASYGMTLAPLSAALRQQYRIGPRVRRGLVVTDVARGSKAAQTGLQPGDVILEVNQKAISSVKGFERIFRSAGSYVVLLVYRSGGTFYLAYMK